MAKFTVTSLIKKTVNAHSPRDFSKENRMAKGSALKKELKCSDLLQEITKTKKISRGELMKVIWKYIKRKGLKGEEDGRIIKLDKRLEPMFKKLAKEKRKIVVRGKTIRIPAGHIFMTELAGGLSKQLG